MMYTQFFNLNYIYLKCKNTKIKWINYIRLQLKRQNSERFKHFSKQKKGRFVALCNTLVRAQIWAKGEIWKIGIGILTVGAHKLKICINSQSIFIREKNLTLYVNIYFLTVEWGHVPPQAWLCACIDKYIYIIEAEIYNWMTDRLKRLIGCKNKSVSKQENKMKQ